MIRIVLTLLAAIPGAWLFYRMKVPAGAMIGAILFSAAFTLLTGMGQVPPWAKPVVQAIAGGFIGQRITRADIGQLRRTLAASLLLLASMAGYTFLAGLLLAKVTSLDLATAMASAMPAGLSDTAIISVDLGADPVQSTFMQMVRMLFCVTVLPQAAFRVCRRWASSEQDQSAEGVGSGPARRGTARDAVVTVILALVAGGVGKISGIPAGAMAFAIFAVAGFNVWKERAYLPKKLRLAAQCVAGCVVGAQVTMDDVRNMREMLLPIVLSIVSLVVCNYLCAWLLHKVCRLDVPTSVFGAIPAGVSDMALISTEMGGDAAKVAVLQLIRYVGILTLMPSLIKWLT